MAATGNPGSYACDDVICAAQHFQDVFSAEDSASETGSLATSVAEMSVRDQLDRLAAALLEDHLQGNPRAAIWIKNWHPQLVGKDQSTIMAAEFSEEDARLVVAKDHGYADWGDVETLGKVQPDPVFEQAVDAVVEGRLQELQQLLAVSPGLAQARSAYGHRAPLLYYLAANGVEIRRQKTPYNAVEIAKELIAAGADPNCTARTYGEACAVVNALVTSSHPAEAGVQLALLETLLDAGAALNGPKDDGSPLSWALAFGQMDAARLLCERGAKMPDLVSAAALGRVELLEQHVTESGQISATFAKYVDPFGKVISDPDEILGLALLAASKYGELAVCKSLLDRGVSANFGNSHGQTGLHFAAYAGSRPVVELLLQHGADISHKDRQHETTAAVWAEMGGHKDLAAWLQRQSQG